MEPVHVQVLVVGSGPGGEGAAMQAVKAGRTVAVIDERPEVGGNCTHRGTIPSKALRQGIVRLLEAKTHQTVSYPALLRAAERVIGQQVNLRTGFYERNRVDIVRGRARFRDAHSVTVEEDGRMVALYTADHVVLATGSRPFRPPALDFGHPRLRDSDTILELRDSPRSVAIYGAGVVGCEYASIFRGLQIKVTLINTRDKLLSFLDDEIIDALSYHLREQGVLIRHNEEFDHLEEAADGLVLHLKSRKQIKTDLVLWAAGRVGNSRDMGLDTVGVEVDNRDYIKINDNYQTTLPHIYAVGDVVGFPSLASAAYDQGRFAATHIVHGRSDQSLVRDIPTGIYTIPEISSIGATERELTAKAVPYEIGHAFFRSLARAQLTGNTVGMLKLLFHRQSLQLLGIHCFGAQASEIIHIGQAIMAQQGEANSLLYFINTTFNYPTMAEAYRVAALNGYNRL